MTCPRRHRQPKPRENPRAFIHIKTNIKLPARVMFRFLVEGYNYGCNASICSEIVGCTPLKKDADVSCLGVHLHVHMCSRPQT